MGFPSAAHFTRHPGNLNLIFGLKVEDAERLDTAALHAN